MIRDGTSNVSVGVSSSDILKFPNARVEFLDFGDALVPLIGIAITGKHPIAISRGESEHD